MTERTLRLLGYRNGEMNKMDNLIYDSLRNSNFIGITYSIDSNYMTSIGNGLTIQSTEGNKKIYFYLYTEKQQQIYVKYYTCWRQSVLCNFHSDDVVWCWCAMVRFATWRHSAATPIVNQISIFDGTRVDDIGIIEISAGNIVQPKWSKLPCSDWLAISGIRISTILITCWCAAALLWCNYIESNHIACVCTNIREFFAFHRNSHKTRVLYQRYFHIVSTQNYYVRYWHSRIAYTDTQTFISFFEFMKFSQNIRTNWKVLVSAFQINPHRLKRNLFNVNICA